MAPRSQPYRLDPPITNEKVEQIDSMFQILFDDLRNGSLTVETTQIEGMPAIVQGDILYGSAAETLAALAKDTNATRYLSNGGTSNNPAWAQVNLTNGVTGDLPLSSLAQAGAASLLFGRGSAAGAGDWESITLGDGLTMTGTVLSAVISATTIPTIGYWTPITDGDEDETDLIFADGEAIMAWVATP